MLLGFTLPFKYGLTDKNPTFLPRRYIIGGVKVYGLKGLNEEYGLPYVEYRLCIDVAEYTLPYDPYGLSIDSGSNLFKDNFPRNCPSFATMKDSLLCILAVIFIHHNYFSYSSRVIGV